MVRIAAVTWPGGGAPPAALSLYKAALEVSKEGSGEFELKILTISPQMPTPMAGPPPPNATPGPPPAVTALEQAFDQEAPDVVLFASGFEFGAAVQRELVQPLDTLGRNDKSLKLEEYFPGALEAASDGGQLYGLPLSVTPMVLQYDKRLFDAAGLGAPDGTWTWSTLLDASKRLTKVSGDPRSDQWGLGLMGPLFLPALIWQNGGEIVSKDGRRVLLAERPALEAIQFFADLVHVYKVVPPPMKRPSGPSDVVMARPAIAPAMAAGETPPLFAPGGRVAMQVTSGYVGPWGIGPFQKGAGGERFIRIAELPRGKVPASSVEVGAVMAITSKASNPRLAYKVLGALAAEMQKELTIPARRSAAKHLKQINPSVTDEDVPVLLAGLESSRAIPMGPQQRIMQVFYQKLQTPIHDGTKTAAEAAREAAEAMDDALNK